MNMALLRFYVMTAADGRQEELRAALVALAAKVRPCDGSEGVELYQDLDAPACFVLVERWRSMEDHKAAGKALGRDAFQPVIALLSQPPEGRYLSPA
jgi:heme oxygenase (mycobilin-producing)